MRKILLLLFLVPVFLCSCEKNGDATTHYGLVYIEDTPEGSFERNLHFTGTKHISYTYNEYEDSNGIMLHTLKIKRYNGFVMDERYQFYLTSRFPLRFVRFEPYQYWNKEKYFNTFKE